MTSPRFVSALLAATGKKTRVSFCPERFVEGDAKDIPLLEELIADCDQVVALVAIIGEKRAVYDREVYSGNIKLAMSHVVPDLV